MRNSKSGSKSKHEAGKGIIEDQCKHEKGIVKTEFSIYVNLETMNSLKQVSPNGTTLKLAYPWLADQRTVSAQRPSVDRPHRLVP